ncbi:hypothetical protein Tco_1057753 [Tanacetum coccineum]|uniref:Uncharacterized protein n=1 Tax=Tanacetum coccineum TaxID=301880 RepID=A0ABQ5H784_9ASTR
MESDEPRDDNSMDYSDQKELSDEYYTKKFCKMNKEDRRDDDKLRRQVGVSVSLCHVFKSAELEKRVSDPAMAANTFLDHGCLCQIHVAFTNGDTVNDDSLRGWGFGNTCPGLGIPEKMIKERECENEGGVWVWEDSGSYGRGPSPSTEMALFFCFKGDSRKDEIRRRVSRTNKININLVGYPGLAASIPEDQ